MYNKPMKKIDYKVEVVYNFIDGYTTDNGFPPTVREIGAHIGTKSTATVYYYLEKLKKCGRISQPSNKNRALTVRDKHNVASFKNSVPLVGNVSAGYGILAVENIEGYYVLPEDIYSGEELFMLRVDGESMRDVGINNGDFVVVNRQSTAEIGEIVVALWNDTATIKRLVSTVPFVLHPENATMEDILISQFDNPIIIGKVVGCMKRF
jgi:repressor LexA